MSMVLTGFLRHYLLNPLLSLDYISIDSSFWLFWTLDMDKGARGHKFGYQLTF